MSARPQLYLARLSAKNTVLWLKKAGYPSDLRAFLQTCSSRKGTGNILIIIVLLVPEEV